MDNNPPPSPENNQQKEKELFLKITSMAMPFGKYKGTLLCDLPVSYLEWFQRKGWPEGQMGQLLATVYEIKLNGLGYLLQPFKKK